MAGEHVVSESPLFHRPPRQCEMYCRSRTSLLQDEAKSVYGPFEPQEGDKADLEASGSGVFGVQFEAVEGSLTQVRGH